MSLLQRAADGGLTPRQTELYFAERRPIFELYDLQADPDEMTNLIDDPAHADRVKDLKRRLMLWMVGEEDYAPLPTNKMLPYAEHPPARATSGPSN